MKILIAYFSKSGYTKDLAKAIESKLISDSRVGPRPAS
jgi:flavodoxin